MSQELHRDIGRLEEAVATLKGDVAKMSADIAELKAMVAQTKGGIRTLIAVGAVAGAIGAGLVKLFAMFKGAS